MPISFFIGPPRTGKTYEAVMTRILGALRDRRRIITNVPLVPEGISDYFSRPGKPFDPPQIVKAEDILSGSVALDELDPAAIIFVKRHHLLDGENYPWDPEGEYIAGKLIMPGDLLVIDEAHVVFPADQKLSERLVSFFRVHGHFYDDRLGNPIDIVIITQDEITLRKEFKYLGETYMKVFPRRGGFRSKLGGYRASYYPTSSCNQSDMIGKPQNRKIRLEIVKCYKSFTHGNGGAVKKPDSRARILSPFMICYFALAPISAIYGTIKLWGNDDEAKNVRVDASKAGSSSFDFGRGGSVRCYDAGIFIDGQWHSAGADGQLKREAGPPRDGCPTEGARHAQSVAYDGFAG